jgi:hypothetical protein
MVVRGGRLLEEGIVSADRKSVGVASPQDDTSSVGVRESSGAASFQAQHHYPRTPASFLKEAERLVSVDRAASHGPYRENHENIAFLWNGWLKARFRAPFDLMPEDVSTMMSLLKKARQVVGDYNHDDFVDDAAYTAITGAMRSGASDR